MSQKSKTTTTIKKGTTRPKTPHQTRGDNMDDEISAFTEDYDPETMAFQRKMIYYYVRARHGSRS
jgi:hypothetical protein